MFPEGFLILSIKGLTISSASFCNIIKLNNMFLMKAQRGNLRAQTVLKNKCPQKKNTTISKGMKICPRR